MIGPYVGWVEQRIRTQPPGPRRRPPNGAAGAAVPGPGRAPETADGPAGKPDGRGGGKPSAKGAGRAAGKAALSSRLRPVSGPPGRARIAGRLYGRRRTGRPTRLTAVGTGVAALVTTVAVAGLDRLAFGGLGVLFGLGYLAICFQLAVRVRFADLLAAPISGPIAFAVAMLLFGPVTSSGVTAQVVALATNLATRAGWLFSGTGLAAVIVLARFVAQHRIHRAR
ncbi:hypothetical protein PUR61_05660 [Streptomyces sp. BE20]|uniref:DUF6542 domain-containing protein n=1 Tax=Streptomyces sp. BE20 TaxID=3002525 RepID=UPI002E767C2E|nr:DUF6542 domain-containing protein [Streptomyces sp. BE20]MEE1821683.1 hypothetical protein [Streptomyces sp. BE20]